MILHPAITEIAERQSRVEKALRSGTLSKDDGRYAGANYAFVYKEVGRYGGPELAKVNPDGNLSQEATDDYYPFVITTSDEDRDGDICVPKGVQIDNFGRSPGVYFAHQEWLVPIGVARTPDNRTAVFPEENRTVSWWYPDKPDPDAMFIAGKVKRRILNSCSQAFVPISATRREQAEKSRTHGGVGGPPLGWLFKEYDLTEWSIVGIPSNPWANRLEKSYRQDIYDRCRGELRDAIDREKQFISPKLVAACQPYCAKSTNEGGGCWTGWCPGPEREAVVVKQVKKSIAKSACSCKGTCDKCRTKEVAVTRPVKKGLLEWAATAARIIWAVASPATYMLNTIMSDDDAEEMYERGESPETAAQKLKPKLKSKVRTAKALTEASGTNGGYAVSNQTVGVDGVPGVGDELTATAPEGFVVCEGCGGEGNCQLCDGTGEDGGLPCSACGGSGECPECAGVGSAEKSVRKAKSEADLKQQMAYYASIGGIGRAPESFFGEIEQWLVANKHPLAYEAGTARGRAASLATEWGINGSKSAKGKTMKKHYLVRTTKGYVKKGEVLVVEDGKEIGEQPGTFWLVNQRGTAVDGPFRTRVEAESAKAKSKSADDGISKDMPDEFTEDEKDAESFPDMDEAQAKADELPPEDEPVVEEKDEEPEEADEPIMMKDSAKVCMKGYQHLKALKDYYEEELPKMDHPGMKEGLEDQEHVDKAMEHHKALMTEHHKGDFPGDDDEYMAKCMKSLEGPVGEDNLVAAGEVPPQAAPMEVDADLDEDEVTTKGRRVRKGVREDIISTLEDLGLNAEVQPGGSGTAWEIRPMDGATARAVNDALRMYDARIEGGRVVIPQYKSLDSNIYQRVQIKGKWTNRIVGKMRRAKDGRVFIVRKDGMDIDGSAVDTHGITAGDKVTYQGKAGLVQTVNGGQADVLFDGGGRARVAVGGLQLVRSARRQVRKISAGQIHLGQKLGPNQYNIGTVVAMSSDGSRVTIKFDDGHVQEYPATDLPHREKGIDPMLDEGAAPFNKDMLPEDDMNEVKDAGEFMEEMSLDDEIPKRHLAPLKHHAKRLGSVHKALSDMGKLQRDGGSGSPLTNQGAVEANGGGGSELVETEDTETDQATGKRDAQIKSKQAMADPKAAALFSDLQKRLKFQFGIGLRGNGGN